MVGNAQSQRGLRLCQLSRIDGRVQLDQGLADRYRLAFVKRNFTDTPGQFGTEDYRFIRDQCANSFNCPIDRPDGWGLCLHGNGLHSPIASSHRALLRLGNIFIYKIGRRNSRHQQNRNNSKNSLFCRHQTSGSKNVKRETYKTRLAVRHTQALRQSFITRNRKIKQCLIRKRSVIAIKSPV
ncbi:hypothetical protein A11S_1177 [Micavibrio aeruginosavorus EPB]|uniref:Uncharacterized protein n=1 Tax=Micavibrio aeruginosavorus EPB TaxID=349215 RepID=M4VIZ0_9BACT|nr:hypothetical protein A11S_1177 [Micavibrio aeruginosavorus EPB]